MSIRSSDITFVIQGPITPSITATSCKNIREHFPKATILLSTWEGQMTAGIDYDTLVLSEDPGSTTVKFNKKNVPHTVNINRQIRSTYEGLKQVKTKFAVKMRSDNYITSSKLISLFGKFGKSTHPILPLNNRILTSNLFAREYTEGMPTPLFFSDFFAFGETQDLMTLWNQPFLKNYEFDEKLKGKRQHSIYPWPQLHVEQWLMNNIVQEHLGIRLRHKYSNDQGQVMLSKTLLARHFIIAERNMLDLHVPDRLNQREGFPFERYSHNRWLELFQKFDNGEIKIENFVRYKLLWFLGRVVMLFKSGIKRKLRLVKCFATTRKRELSI